MGFLNAKDTISIWQTRKEINHVQGPILIQFDNLVSTGLLNDTVTQRRSKPMDMWFYWLRDRAQKGQFHIHWKDGKSNLAEYYTKHFPASHHQVVRSNYFLYNVQAKRYCKGVFKPSEIFIPDKMLFTRTVTCTLTRSCKRNKQASLRVML